jgi:hypothetical protein
VDLVDVFPGVNVTLHGSGQEVEYDFVVAPGADPGAVKVEFEGAEDLRIDEAGDLVLRTKAGEIRQRKPQLYQEGEGGRREPVSGGYVLGGEHEVSFKVGARSRARRLVIDPVLTYSTLVGTSDFASGVAVDGAGNAYITGEVLTGTIPGTVLGGVFDPSQPFVRPAFLARIDPKGALVYFAYLGGNCGEVGYGIAADAAGNAYVTGATCSIDFPLVRAFQSNYGDGVPSGGHSGHAYDMAFVAKVNPAGDSLLYSTYLGGTLSTFGGPFVADIGNAIAMDAAGNVYVTGQTNSVDFPTKGGNVFVPKNWGYAAFVTKFDMSLSGADSVVYSTLYSGDDTIGWGIAVDSAGNAYITGNTTSPSLPPPVVSPKANPGARDADCFLAKLSSSASAVVYSTYLGGTFNEDCRGAALDPAGHVYVVGSTSSQNFPLGAGPPAGSNGMFSATFDGTGSLLSAALLLAFPNPNFVNPAGRSVIAGGVAVNAAGVFVTGFAWNGWFNTGEGFVAKMGLFTGPPWSPLWSQSLPSLLSSAIAADAGGGVYVAGRTLGGTAFVDRFQDETTVPITILPSTPRWKPQKDTTTNVSSNFTSTEPLASATVTLTGPSGVAPISQPFDPNKPPVNLQYTITWAGPWLTDPNKPSSNLATGDYTIAVRGTDGNGATILSAPPQDPNDPPRVSLVEVTKVKFQSVSGGAQIDVNPGTGGGARIFAEARDPIEVDPKQPVFDQVNVLVTVAPAIPDPGAQGPVTVYFRPLDVDDPSDSSGVIDDETKLFDNRGLPPEGTLTDQSGQEIGAGAIVTISVSGDQAQTTLRVSTRQGDNYRVAASTSADWPTHLSVVSASQTGAVEHATDGDVTNAPNLSEMLTVWRTLHAEQLRMEPFQGFAQQDLDVNGTWTKLKSDKLTDHNTDFFNTATWDGVNPSGVIDHTRKNDWRGSDLNPNASAGQDFLVDGNKRHDVTIDSGDMCTAIQEGTCKKASPATYYLRDDKLTSLTNAAPHDTTLLETILGSVYIKVDPWYPSPPFEAFVRNLTRADHNAMHGSVTNTAGYWNVPIMLAFEYSRDSDHDPGRDLIHDSNAEGATSGHCAETTQPGAAVFLEAIRDFQETEISCLRSTVSIDEYIRGTTAHETLHALTLMHDGDHTGALMCAELKNDVTEPNRAKITLSQQAQLRQVVLPRADGLLVDTCPHRNCPP